MHDAMDTLNPALRDVRYCPRCGEEAEIDYPRSISCPHCGYGAYYNPKPVAAAIPVTPDGRIILLRRGFDPGKGLWTFPGGFVDLGESVEQAAVREAMEELEIDIELGPLIGLYSRADERVVLAVYRATTDQVPQDHGRGDGGQGVRAGRAAVGRARVLVDRAGAEGPAERRLAGRQRSPRHHGSMASTLSEPQAPAKPERRNVLRDGARVGTVLAVVVATLLGGYLALVSYRQDRELSVGGIRLSVSPGHTGALDIYVPLVDWGARFESIRAPARLRVDLRTVDRAALQRVADGGSVDLQTVRGEARDAIASYLRALILVVTLCALGLGMLVALAVRSRAGPGLKVTIGAAVTTAIALGVALVVLLPPRGEMDTPQYYAYGADIPRALDAVAAVRRSSDTLDQELDAQLVGLARLVTEPAGRTPVEGRPRITIASDLHNNVITLPILERAAGDGPVFFAGDLSDRGSPLESSLTNQVAHLGSKFVFVTGNHDSDQSAQELADDGAIVLTAGRAAQARRRPRRRRQRDRRACASPATATRSSGRPRTTSPTASSEPTQEQQTRSPTGCGRSSARSTS